MRVKLQHVAHVRSGDKGNTSNITVIAYEPDLYPLLKAQLTAERFKDSTPAWSTAGSALRGRPPWRAELRRARRPGRRGLAIALPRQLRQGAVRRHSGFRARGPRQPRQPPAQLPGRSSATTQRRWRERGGSLQEIASGLRFPEGPVAMPDGSFLVVEIERGTLTRIGADGTISYIAKPGGGPNGAAIGPDGRCYVCNNGGFRWTPEGDPSGLRPIDRPKTTAAVASSGSISRPVPSKSFTGRATGGH